VKLLEKQSLEASHLPFLNICLKKAGKNFLTKPSGRSNVSIISKRQSSLSNEFYNRNQTLQKRFPISLAFIDLTG